MNATLIALGQTMAEAYSWGAAAKASETPFKNMASVTEAAALPGLADLQAGIADLLKEEGAGTKIFAKADALIDRFPAFDELREYLIDLCVVLLLSELEEEDDEAFESPAWLKIEEAAADRGTELLNALIYIKECKLAEVDADLEDFLYEFLLADDEDYQDELAIYEPFIEGLEKIDLPLKQLIQDGNDQSDSEILELYTPLMLFFRDAEKQPGKVTLALLENSALPALHCALFRLLCAAWQAEM